MVELRLKIVKNCSVRHVALQCRFVRERERTVDTLSVITRQHLIVSDVSVCTVCDAVMMMLMMMIIVCKQIIMCERARHHHTASAGARQGSTLWSQSCLQHRECLQRH